MAEVLLTFLGPVIEGAISRGYSFIKERIATALGLEKELDRLVDSLTFIQSVLQYAEEQQESDPAIQRWLQKLNDVAYEAMDLLGECEYKVLEHKVKSRGGILAKKMKTQGGKSNPPSISFSDKFCRGMAGKINGISEQLKDLKDSASMINLVVSLRGRSCSIARQLPKTDSFLDESKVFGREDDVSRIVSMLRDMRRRQHCLSGISIVGMGGIGKTTIAKSVYRKAKEEKLYDLLAWVCVSEDFNDQIILGEMLRYFDRNAAPTDNINALLEDLAKELEKKTFLLVLDDVWNDDPDKWESSALACQTF